MLQGEQLILVDSLSYLLARCLTKDGSSAAKVGKRISPVQTAYAWLNGFRIRPDILLKCLLCRGLLVLLFSCETWSLHAKGVCRLGVFDYRCLRCISRIGWTERVSNVLVRNFVLSVDPENNLTAYEA